MKKSLLGSLMSSHPDAQPVVEKLRKKYNLPEFSPDDDPITEVYLGNGIITLEVFGDEIENML